MSNIVKIHLVNEEIIIPNKEWFEKLDLFIEEIKNRPAKRIWDLSEQEICQLRKEIVLGSMYYKDYENNQGLNCYEVCNFFDGYVEYLWEIASENGMDNIDDVSSLDNTENLIDYFSMEEADENHRNFYRINHPEGEQNDILSKVEILENLKEVYDEMGYDETLEWIYCVA